MDYATGQFKKPVDSATVWACGQIHQSSRFPQPITNPEGYSIQPGDCLNEYEILNPLGAGGMGEVYLALDRRLQRQAALKVLRVAPDDEARRLDRFAGEARAASALNHPNITHIYGVGQCDDICYIAMEYVKGRTLRASELSTDQKVDAVIQAASALSAAHSAGIVHRDIKPVNIMRTHDGLVKVLDFGLAKRIDLASADDHGLTRPGMVVGTLGYMSPEQILGRPVDHRTDIFSLGVVLYELLTGKLPYTASSFQAALAELTAPQACTATAGLAPALAATVTRAIDRDPDRRFQSAVEFADALKAAQGATETAPGYAAGRSRREWLAAAGVVLTAGGFGGYRFWHGDPIPTGPVRSLAILPFSAAGLNADLEYLREGIAEGIMNRLSAVQGLRVMSRDSSFRCASMGAVDAGRHLRVRGVVSGTIRAVEQTIVVAAELVDAATGERIWGGDFERPAGEVLHIRDAIATAITERLSGELEQPPAPAAAAVPARETSNAQAHDLYLRGKFLTARFDPDQLRQGVDCFEQAIAADPGYALAHVGLAEAHLFAADLFEQASALLPKARESATRALEADPQLADAHLAMGLVAMHADLDWPAAEKSLRTAISLNPALAPAHGFLGWLLSATGRDAPGLDEGRRAVALEPQSPLTHALLAANFYFTGSNTESFAESGRALDIDAEFQLALLWRGLAMIGMGFPGMVASRLEGARTHTGSPLIFAALARAHAASGNHKKARAALADLTRAAETQHVSAILFAAVHAALGDRDEAFTWLDRAYESRAKLLLWLGRDPAYQNLRADPRFASHLSRLKLA